MLSWLASGSYCHSWTTWLDFDDVQGRGRPCAVATIDLIPSPSRSSLLIGPQADPEYSGTSTYKVTQTICHRHASLTGIAMDELQEFAFYPLTQFDRVFERSAFVTGWLVDGTLDLGRLSEALTRVTEKWRMLAGRLNSFQDESQVFYFGSDVPDTDQIFQQHIEWRLKVPLGRLKTNYQTFSLTSTQSEVPITDYIPLPLPLDSPSLPPKLFAHSTIPRQYTAWETGDHPLTWWHVTHFPASSNGKTHTCIGFSRCHGVFDGIGAARIVEALVAELNGDTWVVPEPLKPGLNENVVERVLQPAMAERMERQKEYWDRDSVFTVLTPGQLLRFCAGHMYQKLWGGADRRIIVLPQPALQCLVNSVRSATPTNKLHVSTGDILTAWFLKVSFLCREYESRLTIRCQTIYSQGSPPATVVHCSNIASFRPLLSQLIGDIENYPHNAWAALPYPLMSVEDLNKISIGNLSQRLAQGRSCFSFSEIISAYTRLKTSPGTLPMPTHPNAEETFLVSNVSASRILEADWTGANGGRTVCSYRYSLTPNGLLLTNTLYISGRLEEGLVLDVTLTKFRLHLVLTALKELVKKAGNSEDILLK